MLSSLARFRSFLCVNIASVFFSIGVVPGAFDKKNNQLYVGINILVWRVGGLG